MKKSYRILQLQFYTGTHPSTYNLHVHSYTTVQRILHPESNSTCRRQRALRVLLLHYRGQRDLQSRFQKRNSTHRRQGDLLEIHPCVLQDIPGTPATRPSKDTPETFRTFQSASPGNSAMFQYLQGIHPFQHSPIRMHILHILQFLQFDWFPQKTPPSTSWAITNITLQTFILQRKGDVVISVKRASVKDVKMTYFPE